MNQDVNWRMQRNVKYLYTLVLFVALLFSIVCFVYNKTNGRNNYATGFVLYSTIAWFLFSFVPSRPVVVVLSFSGVVFFSSISGIALVKILVSLLNKNPGGELDALNAIVYFFLTFFHLFGVILLTIPDNISTINRKKG